MANNLYMFNGRVDVINVTGYQLAAQSQISGIEFRPVRFGQLLNKALRETREGGQFIAKGLTDAGYPARVRKPTISVLSGLVLVQCTVEHQEHDDRHERLVMDTVVHNLIDQFNLDFNDSPI